MKQVQVFGVMMLSCILQGCIAYTSYQGDLKPVNPKPHGIRFYAPVQVNSLHPRFEWQGTGPDQKVDLAIWEGVYKGQGLRNNTSRYNRGPLVYYIEGITGNAHEIRTNLAPATIYYWSIKPTGTMNWATAKHESTVATGYLMTSEHAGGLFFAFQTPETYKGEAAKKIATQLETSQKEPRKNIPDPKPDEGVVYIYRNSKFVGFAASPEIKADGVKIADLKNGTFLFINLKSGQHEFTSSAATKTPQTVKVEAGKTYYIEVNVNMGGFSMKTSDEVEAKKAIEKLKLCP